MGYCDICMERCRERVISVWGLTMVKNNSSNWSSLYSRDRFTPCGLFPV